MPAEKASGRFVLTDTVLRGEANSTRELITLTTSVTWSVHPRLINASQTIKEVMHSLDASAFSPIDLLPARTRIVLTMYDFATQRYRHLTGHHFSVVITTPQDWQQLLDNLDLALEPFQDTPSPTQENPNAEAEKP